ncbi:hypothetical protein MUTS15_44290 [Escherichia coli]|nr:hypothetical protein MUTS15_44290 [Escherichia coli]
MDFCRNYYRLDFDKLVEIPWGLIYFDDIHFANKNIIQRIVILVFSWELIGKEKVGKQP